MPSPDLFVVIPRLQVTFKGRPHASLATPREKHTEQILTLLFNRIKYCYLIDVENEVQELT